MRASLNAHCSADSSSGWPSATYTGHTSVSRLITDLADANDADKHDKMERDLGAFTQFNCEEAEQVGERALNIHIIDSNQVFYLSQLR